MPQCLLEALPAKVMTCTQATCIKCYAVQDCECILLSYASTAASFHKHERFVAYSHVICMHVQCVTLQACAVLNKKPW